MKKNILVLGIYTCLLKLLFLSLGGGGGGIKSSERETSEHFLLDVSIWSKTDIQNIFEVIEVIHMTLKDVTLLPGLVRRKRV